MTRILKADISAPANDDENHHREQVHPEHSRSDWDHEHIERVSEMMDRAQRHIDEAERLKAQGMPEPKRRR